MNFFCTKNHCNTWINKLGIEDKNIYILDVYTGLIVGKAIFNEHK